MKAPKRPIRRWGNLAVALVVLCGGCAAPSGQGTPEPTGTTGTAGETQTTTSSPGSSDSPATALPTQNTFQPMWVDSLPSIKAMAAKAELIVRGETLQESESTIIRGLPFTSASYRPAEWIKGKPSTSDSIRIRQLGGEQNGIVRMAEGNPLMQPGEESILFLRKSDEGEYGIMGGPTGRYLIVDGKVTAMKASANTTKFPENPDQFIELIRKLGAAK